MIEFTARGIAYTVVGALIGAVFGAAYAVTEATAKSEDK